MGNKLGLTDHLNNSKNSKITVADILSKKGELFKYIKRGYEFKDDVLEKARIKKNVRDQKTITVVVTHEEDKTNKEYHKDTESLRNVLKSIHTIANQSYKDTIEENYVNTVYNSSEI